MATVNFQDNDPLQLKVWEKHLRQQAIHGTWPVKLPLWFVRQCRKKNRLTTLKTLQGLVKTLNSQRPTTLH